MDMVLTNARVFDGVDGEVIPDGAV